MKKMMNWILGRKRTRVVELPEAFGLRPSMGELQAALLGKNDDPAVKALAQLMYFRSLKLCDAGKADAWKGQDTRYQLGGANALDELLEDVLKLCEQGTVPEDLREFFVAK